MFRRDTLRALGLLAGGHVPTVAGVVPSSEAVTLTRTDPWPEWMVPVHVDIPREVYTERRVYDTRPEHTEARLFDHIDWDFRWTVGGRPVDDLPSP